MEEKTSFLSKLRQSLKKTGGGLLQGVFANSERIDDAFYEELEEALILSDAGMETTQTVMAQLQQRVQTEKMKARAEAREALRDILTALMEPETPFLPSVPAVILIVGVNGVGKTTSIGKLAAYYKQQGMRPMIAAADTFRAAAAEQLGVWAARTDTPFIRHGEGADPAAVVFDACASFKAKGLDVLLCDTAGRLHNKANLMRELEKIHRVIGRELPEAAAEVLLVIDATTGQNAIAQADAFAAAAGVSGVILTKLDGTAKGGVAVAITQKLGLPVRFIGVGEGIDDLQPFDARQFAEALV